MKRELNNKMGNNLHLRQMEINFGIDLDLNKIFNLKQQRFLIGNYQ